MLGAVWETPFIFQGCFKVTELKRKKNCFFYFRCQASNVQQSDILNYDFSPEQYVFTHLYNETGEIKK
ncbi:MAG: hypothetical protein CK430_09740 [Legionella sp.]|nr:MAG: hypothetical protein CK430_09740 [Legionella sp.]